MKDWKYNLVTLVLIAVSLISFYFISVNSLFSNKLLAKVEVNGQIYSLLPEEQAKALLAEQAGSILPPYLNFNVNGARFSLETAALAPRVDISSITSFGKGKDLGKVLGDSIALISGRVVNNADFNFEVDSDAFLLKLPYKNDSANGAYLLDGKVYNCDSRSFNLDYDKAKVTALINQSIRDKTDITFDYRDILSDPGQAYLISYCESYYQSTASLSSLIEGLNDWGQILVYDLYSANATRLEFLPGGEQRLSAELQTLGTRLELASDPGAYIPEGSTLYMYRKPQTGRQLDQEQTLNSLRSWLANPKGTDEILRFQTLAPPAPAAGFTVVDVSKKLAEGKSRLDIIRDGLENYRIQKAEDPLKALNGFVLAPGESFSFYEDSGIKSGTTKAGFGTCNSSTTVFRMALMAGFPITERSPHSFYVWSYEYPFYPINNVEATFFGGPIVDLKFYNDLNYPVVLRFSSDRTPNDGFQYHTLEAFTSPLAPERQVELVDFKKWNERSEKQFSSSFTRKVWEEGKLLREDTYKAYYH